MEIRASVLALILPAAGMCFPPGAPMSDFGPSQVSLAAYFDHSGQDLFESGAPSVLNSTGLSLDYGPWPFLQFGLFGGAAEFDVGLPENRLSDPDAFAFNADYSFSAGASMKLATPRFASGTTRGVAFGSLSYVDGKDTPGNSKMALVYDGGASIQYLFLGKVNFVLGGEFHTLEGEQKSAAGGASVPFSTTAPVGITDYLRGLVGVEYYFKGKNHPFVSVAFRPTGSIGWHDDLGLRNASVSISLGAMTTLGKAKPDGAEEEESLIDE